MGNIKEIKIIMRKAGMLRTPGDMITITDDDLESYNRVREALQVLTEDIHGLASSPKEGE